MKALLLDIETDPSKLHGQRAGALRHVTILDVPDDSAQDSPEIDAAMVEVARIFPGDQRIQKKRRDLLQRHHTAVRTVQAANHVAMPVQHARALRHAAHFVDIETGRKVKIKTTGQAGGNDTENDHEAQEAPK